MSSIDFLKTYYLINSLKQTEYVLASKFPDSKIGMVPSNSTDANAQWKLDPEIRYANYFYLQTIQGGSSQALDVYNDKDVQSENVLMTTRGLFTGQLWRIDMWSDSTYKLSNNFTGFNMNLGVNPDTLQAVLLPTEDSSQHWKLVTDLAALTSTTSSATSAPTSSPIPTTTSSRPTDTSTAAASSAASNGLSVGAIVGVAFGGFFAIVLIVGAFFLLWRRRKGKSSASGAGTTEQPPDYGRSTKSAAVASISPQPMPPYYPHQFASPPQGGQAFGPAGVPNAGTYPADGRPVELSGYGRPAELSAYSSQAGQAVPSELSGYGQGYRSPT